MATGYKTGGRTAGTPNKSTEDLRNIIQAFINRNIDEMQKNFDLLEPKDKLSFIEKMLNYSLPRFQNTQLNADIKHPQIIEYKNVSIQYPDR